MDDTIIEIYYYRGLCAYNLGLKENGCANSNITKEYSYNGAYKMIS